MNENLSGTGLFFIYAKEMALIGKVHYFENNVKSFFKKSSPYTVNEPWGRPIKYFFLKHIP